MKRKFVIFLITLSTFFTFSCKNENSVKFSKNGLDVIADTITYTAIIKNPDKTDTWTEQCLSRLDIKAFSNLIFDEIYAGKLKPYNYQLGYVMTLEEVKEFEKEYSRSRIGKALFTEEWYFDKKNTQMIKRVNSVMLAYEIMGFQEKNPLAEEIGIEDTTQVVTGYKSGIRVYFNGTEPKPQPRELSLN